MNDQEKKDKLTAKIGSLFDEKARAAVADASLNDLHRQYEHIVWFLNEEREELMKHGVVRSLDLLSMAGTLADEITNQRKLGPAAPIYFAALAIYSIALANGFTFERSSLARMHAELSLEQLAVMDEVVEEIENRKKE